MNGYTYQFHVLVFFHFISNSDGYYDDYCYLYAYSLSLHTSNLNMVVDRSTGSAVHCICIGFCEELFLVLGLL